MRIAFVGAVEGSAAAFDALVQAGLTPVLLITLRPEDAARHSDFVDMCPAAKAAGAALHLTSHINAPETVKALRRAEPDLTMVIGWSQICRAEFRSVASIATIGFHPAPLPRFRGRAVIPWTILADERETGSTIFRLDNGVDSGPIIVQRHFKVAPDETARSLYDKQKMALVQLAPEAVHALAQDNACGVPQVHSLASFCAKRTPEDGLINWQKSAAPILRLIRAVGEPYPGAFTLESGEKIIIDDARLFTTPGRFIGIAGQVQSHTERGFTVLCGDGSAVEVMRWRGGANAKPKVHARLA